MGKSSFLKRRKEGVNPMLQMLKGLLVLMGVKNVMYGGEHIETDSMHTDSLPGND